MTALLVSVVRADRPAHFTCDSRKYSSAFLVRKERQRTPETASKQPAGLRPAPRSLQVHSGRGGQALTEPAP